MVKSECHFFDCYCPKRLYISVPITLTIILTMIYIPVYINTQMPGPEIFSTFKETHCNDTEIQLNLTKHCKLNLTEYITNTPPIFYFINVTAESLDFENSTSQNSTVPVNTTKNKTSN